MRTGIAIFALSALLPLSLFAQTEEDQLRSQIRADLLKDPRSAQLSQAELDSLVDALAQKAADEGTVQDYLDAQNTFDYSKQFEKPRNATVVGALTSPIMVALISLILVLVLVIVYIVRRGAKRVPDEMS